MEAEISNEVRKNIQQFESQISSLDANSTEEQTNKIKDEIDDQKFKIERILFSNKTIYFIKDCQIKKKKSTFLLVINDAYINKNHILKSEKLNSPRPELPEQLLLRKNEQNFNSELTEDRLNEILLIANLSETEILHIKEFNFNDIKELNLSNKKFGKIVNTTFFGLKNLEKLYLIFFNGFNFQKLPPNVLTHLKNLKELDLTFNQLTDVPNLCSLSNLQILHISVNELKRIPDLNGLFKLKELHLSNNKIEEIDSDAFDGLNLEKLFLSGNHLEEISFGIPSLKELNLFDNYISSLSADTFQGFPLLETLVLKSNSVCSIESDTFLCLPNLINLDLNDNLIEKAFPNAFSGLNKLKTLKLGACETNKFDYKLFQSLSSLKLLSISNNTYSKEKQEPPLKEINSRIFTYLVNLEILTLRGWIINSFEENLLKSLGKLKVLDIKHSKLNNCNKNIFNELTSLKEIRFSEDQKEFFEQYPLRENVKLKLVRTQKEISL